MKKRKRQPTVRTLPQTSSLLVLAFGKAKEGILLEAVKEAFLVVQQLNKGSCTAGITTALELCDPQWLREHDKLHGV